MREDEIVRKRNGDMRMGGVETIREEARRSKMKRKRKEQKSVQMTRGVEQVRMLMQDLKHRKYICSN
jgi:hypothetical protein